MRAGLRILALAASFAGGTLLLTCSGVTERAAVVEPIAGVDRTPVVFVSGVTGTKLRDPDSGELRWGSVRSLLRPRDDGYDLVLPLEAETSGGDAAAVHPQARYEAVSPIWKVRFPGWTKEVYRPLRQSFEAAGYRLGHLAEPRTAENLFFFDYDWRYGNLDSVRKLDRLLTALTAGRGSSEVDLICQSNAAKICRWLAKYGALGLEEAEAGKAWERGYRIRRLALAGVSNRGALRVMQFLIQGRSYVPLVGRQLSQELFFSVRPLFEDLPSDRDDLFFDESGEILDIDLFDARNWEEYGWSIFGRGSQRRLERDPRSDLFGDRQTQIAYLEQQLVRSRRFQRLLARDSAGFPDVEYFLLENDSAPTIDRALLTRQDGEWQTFFLGDGRIDRDPELRHLAAAPGDGHAVLDSQRGLSPQETAALVETVKVGGGHFEAVIQPEALDAMVSFLTRP